MPFGTACLSRNFVATRRRVGFIPSKMLPYTEHTLVKLLYTSLTLLRTCPGPVGKVDLLLL